MSRKVSTPRVAATTINCRSGKSRTRMNIRCVPCKLQNGDFDTTTKDNVDDIPSPRSEEAFADRFGIRVALLGLCIASLIAAIWFVRSPSFEKCSAIENVSDRNACYDQLRQELLKPPAKGADIPKR